MSEGDGFRETRKDLERVIRRLNALELLILLGAVAVALGGGALVAFLLSTGTRLPFRPTWAVLSLLLLLVPGVAVLGRERRHEARKQRNTGDSSNNGA